MQMFPNDLKKAKITPPNFKKYSEIDPINSLPISVTAALSKIFEKQMHIQMIYYLDRKKTLSPRQLGFRKTRSNKNASLNVNEK